MRKGFEAITNPHCRKIAEDELTTLLNEYMTVRILGGTETIGEGAITKAKGCLKVISRVGVGWDSVDKKSANIC